MIVIAEANDLNTLPLDNLIELVLDYEDKMYDDDMNGVQQKKLIVY